MKRYLVYLFFLIFSFHLSCNYSKKKADKNNNFYNKPGTFDRLRIPLIKPYDLIKVSDAEWQMDLHTTNLLTLGVDNVKGVALYKNIILLYSKGGTEVKNKYADEWWFVIYPDSRKETAFDNYKSFHDTLVKEGIINVVLKDPDQLYNESKQVND